KQVRVVVGLGRDVDACADRHQLKHAPRPCERRIDGDRDVSRLVSTDVEAAQEGPNEFVSSMCDEEVTEVPSPRSADEHWTRAAKFQRAERVPTLSIPIAVPGADVPAEKEVAHRENARPRRRSSRSPPPSSRTA